MIADDASTTVRPSAARRAGACKTGAESPGWRDMEPEFLSLYERCQPFTMTSIERMYAVFKAVNHIVAAGVPGDIVECGVWRGGCMMLAALVLQRLGDRARKLFLYDTFAGMTAPGDADSDLFGRPASQVMLDSGVAAPDQWCAAGIDFVRSNLLCTEFPADRVVFVQGPVESTIPGVMPDRVALLRLDTDWYESTAHELEHLYPRLERGGVLIIDDYGHWRGARQATDEYFQRTGEAILLQRTDYTGRMGVRTSAPRR